MTRRTGTSLIEVLVTIGILGIGLISVIAMFPMAAITMGQALRDDRTASSAVTADGYIRNVHHLNVVEPYLTPQSSPSEPYYYAMDGNNPPNPFPSGPMSALTGTTPTSPSLSLPSQQLGSSDTNPSYPVFVDPMGIAAGGGSAVGDLMFGSPAPNTFAIPRVTLSVMNGQSSTLALRLCSQMDGLTYGDQGLVQSNGGVITRELRYNWLWVLQRPTNSDRLTTTCKVVVFDRRVYLYKPPGTEALYAPVAPASGAFTTGFNPGQTIITIPGTTADVRKGSWVMDGTIGTDPNGLPIRHANFYRVLSVETDANGNYALEVHTPVFRIDGLTGSANGYNGNLLVMPAVADVYERPALTAAVGP